MNMCVILRHAKLSCLYLVYMKSVFRMCVCASFFGTEGQSVRDEFRSGAEVSCPNIVFHGLHENQVVLPEYLPKFCPKMAI